MSKKDTIANLEIAIDEVRHYILMDTDSFAVQIGDIVIRRVK